MGPAVIPKPVTMTPGTGAFVVRASSDVSVAPSTPETRRIAGVLARMLGTKVVTAPAPVSLQLAGGAGLGDEGYDLTVTPSTVRLASASPAGLSRRCASSCPYRGHGASRPSISATDRASPGAAPCSTWPATSGPSATSSGSST